jgi:hypothetical protein
MSPAIRNLLAAFCIAPLLLLMPVTGSEQQGRTGGQHPSHPPRHVVGAQPGHVVFIGGYFYDPFYGPYPWWPRVAYPGWYVPQYDLRAHIRVAATPRAAAVYVDGFYAGVVDDFDGVFQSLPLTPGGHELTLYLDGYVTTKWRLYLQPGSDMTLRHAMVTAPAGMPSEPPDVAPPVPAPPHGSYTAPKAPATQLPARPALVRGFGTIAIRVQPPGAEIRIDGEACLSSAPGYCETYVSVGPHRIEITMPGHQPFATSVEITEGKVESLNVILPTT